MRSYRLMAVQTVMLLIVLCSMRSFADDFDAWSSVDTALKSGIASHAYPGCTAMVFNPKGVLYWRSFGNYTYGIPPPYNHNTNPPMQLETLFDMASVTKVIATTTAVAQFYQRGELDLNATVASIIGSQFAVNGKGPIKVVNCLVHDTGFPPDPDPNYWDPAFGCPQTSQPLPAEDFSCQTKIYNSVMNQTLENPIGSVYVYSDLSMITLMYVVGHLARQYNYVSTSDLLPACNTGGPGIEQCYYEAYVRKYVFSQYNMKTTSFLPPQNVWHLAAPCENDTTYTHKVIQGQVSDGNAYAMGGIAGHAGMFSQPGDLYQLLHQLLTATSKPISPYYLNVSTVTLFTTEYNHSQSSSALGWNTNDPTVYNQGWSNCCGNWSAKTFMHTGYTGTQICCDPVAQVCTVFLTNRVYPNSNNNQMLQFRQAFNNAVIGVLKSSTASRRPTLTHKQMMKIALAEPTFRRRLHDR